MNNTIIRGRSLVEPHTPPEFPARPAFMTQPGLPCHGKNLWTSGEQEDLRQAAKLCRALACPALDECGRWAVENGEQHHVWGGMVFPLRKRLHRVRPARERITPERNLRGAMALHAVDKPDLFGRLTDDARVQAVLHGRELGHSWSRLSQIWGHKVSTLQEMAGVVPITHQVRDLYNAGKNDTEIAQTIGVDTRKVARIRREQGLTPKFGPGGKRLERVAA